MKRSIALRRAGVTLTELLVVLVIISILATIAVPVYINKAENARIATAQLECRLIAEAEDTCAMHHGFYVPLQVLDDMPANTLTTTNADSIDRETNVYAIDPNKPLQYLDDNQNNLLIQKVSQDPRITKMVNNWQGPFLNPQRVYTGPATTVDPNYLGTYNQLDYPLDPWGQPYRFYAPYPWGVIGTNAAQSDPTNWTTVQFSDGRIVKSTNPPQFDRYAIVSYGPNGVANDTNTSLQNVQDDIMYFFGRVVPGTVVNNNGTTGTATATPTPTP